MIKTDENNVKDLQERTRLRNTTLWVSINPGNILDPIQSEVDMLRHLGAPGINGYIDIQEEEFGIKEYQRDTMVQLENDKITQDERIINAEAATKRELLAIKLTTEKYVLEVEKFDSMVKDQLMLAREYVSKIEQEQLSVEGLNSAIAVQKSINHLKEINAEKRLEYIKQKETEVDIKRNEIEALKAQVNSLLADNAAIEAEASVIESEVKEKMTMADKISLQADIASIFAEVIVKGLVKTKFAVERDAIAAGFGYIQSKLEDVIALWNERSRIENLRTKNEEDIYQEILSDIETKKAAIDLKSDEMSYSETLQGYREDQESTYLDYDQTLINNRLSANKSLAKTKSEGDISINDATASAKKQVNTAQRTVYKNHKATRTSIDKEIMYISNK